ncbi:hypothetical protein BDV59DRAFT_206549 [Aspergillus ambiguus]|uniref:uncharacterized protein n=1 Tax=Aspergillus ambiguus TaxID=176160 RepID=UPI003CCDFA9D
MDSHSPDHTSSSSPDPQFLLPASRPRHRPHSRSDRLPRMTPVKPRNPDRDKDPDPNGLLRPITRETTRARWGSDSTVGVGSGSRQDSLVDDIDPTRRGLIRPRDIRSVDDLEQVRDRRKQGEEYLRSVLSFIGTLATDITRRLDYTYYNLLEKIAALNTTVASFQELSDSTTTLLTDFERETVRLEQDIRKQIGDLHEFQPQIQRIEDLEERMRAGRARASALSDRLELMRAEIDRWEKREVEFQTRVNRRLRIFWAVVAAAFLAALLAVLLQSHSDRWRAQSTRGSDGQSTSGVPLPPTDPLRILDEL